MICIKTEIPQEICDIDDELKAIYHSKDTERTDFTPIRLQPPLPNQRNQYVTIVKTVKTARFIAV